MRSPRQGRVPGTLVQRICPVLVALLAAAFLGACDDGRSPFDGGIDADMGDGCGEGDPDGPSTRALQGQVAGEGLDGPIDAVLDPSLTALYFIGRSAGALGVFSLLIDNGEVQELFSGRPLVEPRSLVISPDGRTLYVADPAAGADGEGAIYALSSRGGQPEPVHATESTVPMGLAIDDRDGTTRLYWTGVASDGLPALLTVSPPLLARQVREPADPDHPQDRTTTLHKGRPLVSPDGLAVDSNGLIYLTDRQNGAGTGQVYVFLPSGPAAFGEPVTLGTPGGIAVSQSGTRVLVSTLDGCGRSTLTVLDSASQLQTPFRMLPDGRAAGGLHRAFDSDVFSWTDPATGGQGSITVIE